VLTRANRIRKDLKEHLKMSPAGKRVGVVGHNMFFRILTAKDEFWQKHPEQLPDVPDCLSLKNCEFAPYTL
jgi:hypothetical protein